MEIRASHFQTKDSGEHKVGCPLICADGESTCVACTEYMAYVNNTKRAKEKYLLKPVHVKAPVSKTSPGKMKLTLQGQRL